MPGLRERKKQRTRQAIAAAALRLFVEQGFEATTVEAICADAEIAVSTFYAYFDSKEAAVFPDEAGRTAVVTATLTERPPGEPLHVTLRRAAHALVQQDLETADALAARLELLAREPALAAHAARGQDRYADELSTLVATEMRVEAVADPRPRLVISAVLGALNAAYTSWAADPSRDLPVLVAQALDLLDLGFERALSEPA